MARDRLNIEAMKDCKMVGMTPRFCSLTVKGKTLFGVWSHRIPTQTSIFVCVCVSIFKKSSFIDFLPVC